MTAIGIIGACMVIIAVHVTFPFWQHSAAHRFMQRAVHKTASLVKQAWGHATWYEKVGLVIFCFGWLIPGPVDEMLGLLLIRRILKRAKRKLPPHTGPKPEWMSQV